MRRVLEAGQNCGVIARVDEGGAIVDAEAYYRAVHRAIVGAQRYVLLSGWQFSSDVHLLRGDETAGIDAPTQLLPLLDWACRRAPGLEIYILAWDFGAVFAIEREWFQKHRFTSTAAGDQIHFAWDDFLPTGASHHQKLVVVDGLIAFSGGIDLCTSRWDRREHATVDPLRCRPNGKPAKPYHDIQAFVRGPVVQELEAIFAGRWCANTGEDLELEPMSAPPPSLDDLTDGAGLPLHGPEVALSQTRIPPSHVETPALREIRALYHDAILAAERLVYLENQYFTSRSLTRAFVERLENRHRPRIAIVIVMPRGGDTPKEKLALGDAQQFALATIAEAARRHGHEFRLFFTGADAKDGSFTPTFIHSKILIVDDRLLSIGSANTTNRSFGLDSELNLTWETEGETRLSHDIAALRASLIAEHCGAPDPRPWLDPVHLVQRLDETVGAGCRLRASTLEPPDDRDSLLSLGTDPTGPVDGDMIGDRLDEAWESIDAGWFRSGLESALARLGLADAGSDD